MSTPMKIEFPKGTKEVAPGMFRAPTPVNKANPEANTAASAAGTEAPATSTAVPEAEVKPTTPPPAPDTSFDVLVLRAKTIRTHLVQTWAGKEGVNPFIYVKQEIDPLLERAKNNDRSDDLRNKLIALSEDTKPVVEVQVQDHNPPPPSR